jgi:predicted hydrocarbon binding protein
VYGRRGDPLFPMSLPLICVRRGRRVAEITALSRDLSSIVVLLSSILSRRSLDVVSGSITRKHGGEVVFTLFLDYTDTGMSLDSLRESLSSFNVVERVLANGTVSEGVAMNSHAFPLLLGERRVIILPTELFERIASFFRVSLGGVANTVLYELGRMCGGAAARQFRASPNRGNGEETVRMGLAMIQAAGWGIVEDLYSDSSKMAWRVSVRDLFECVSSKSDEGGNKSHFFRGYLAGLFQEAYGLERVSCVESLCASNHAASCEFSIWV